MPVEKVYIVAAGLLTAAAAQADSVGLLSPIAGATVLFTIIFAFGAIQANRLLTRSESHDETLRSMKQSWYGDPNKKDDDGALGKIERACAAIASEPEARKILANQLHVALNEMSERLEGRIGTIEEKVDAALQNLEVQTPRRSPHPK